MIAMYNQDIIMLQSTRYSIAQQVKEQPYTDLQQTDNYIQYINNIGDVDSRINQINDEILDSKEKGYYGSNATTNLMLSLPYMTPEDKGVYCYLYDTKGKEAADQYLEAITDKLNKAQGFEWAKDFLETIAKRDGNGNIIFDENGKIVIDQTLLTAAKVAGKGFFNGVTNFGEGLENVFSSDGIMSANQYAQTYILEALYNCGAESVLPDIYNFNFSLGNLAVPTVAAIFISTVYPPAGATLFMIGSSQVTAAGIFGYSLMGLSIYGNAKNNALMSGATKNTARLYGLCNGLSEIGLGILLGNLPVLNGGANFALLGLIKEGTEEYIQEYISAGLDYIFLKQPIDAYDLDEKARKSFLYGVFMSGMLNGVKTIPVKFGNQEIILDTQKITDYMNEHDGATIFEAIEKTSNVNLTISQADAYIVDEAVKQVLSGNGEVTGRGSSKLCYKVEVNGQEYAVLKVFNEVDGYEATFDSEKKVIDNLINQGLNTPRFVGKTIIDGQLYVVQEYATGIDLASRNNENHDTYSFAEHNAMALDNLSNASVEAWEDFILGLQIITKNGFIVDQHANNFLYDSETDTFSFVDLNLTGGTTYNLSDNIPNILENIISMNEKSLAGIYQYGIYDVNFDYKAFEQIKSNAMQAYENVINNSDMPPNMKVELIKRIRERFEAITIDEKYINVEEKSVEQLAQEKTSRAVKFYEWNLTARTTDINEYFSIDNPNIPVTEDNVRIALEELGDITSADNLLKLQITPNDLIINIAEDGTVSLDLSEDFKNKVYTSSLQDITNGRNEILNNK